MEITAAEVEQIAQLARLRLEDEEVEMLAHDLGAILGHMDALREADVSDTPPVAIVSEHSAPFRTDALGADPLRLPPDQIAPEMREGFFVVPRLAALDADALAGEGSAA